MGKSKYVEDLRRKVGKDLLLVPGVAAVIKNAEGQILVQKNTDGVWNLPAGAIDPGEKPAQAIVREIFEETGLVARPTRIIGVIGGAPEYRMQYDNGDQVESTTIVFACEVVGGELEPQDDETARLKYVEPDATPELATNTPKEMLTVPDLMGYFEWDSAWLKDIK